MFTLDLEATAGPTWVDLRGAAASAGVQAGGVSGVVAEGAVGLAPGLTLGLVHVAVLFQGGANFSRARGYVSGDSDVSLAGPWFGASLVIGVGEGGG
jgi:hypothetical protein